MRDLQQSFSIDKDTGMVTYFTDMSGGHDGATDTDGQGNMLTFTISATDNGMVNGSPSDPATATVMVRVNVAPSAINLTSNDGANTDAAPLPPPPATGKAGTALTVVDNTDVAAGGDADSNPDNLTFMDDDEQDRRKVADLNVLDQNAMGDKFGTHKITLSGKGANMFEARETRDADNDGSTWELWLKKDAKFDYEALATAAEKEAGTPITLYITVTATDGGGLSTKGNITVRVMDAKTDDDDDGSNGNGDETTKDPEVPGLEDDADDSDNDGPVIPLPPPPGDGGAFIGDDLLDDFVAAIDDIDVA